MNIMPMLIRRELWEHRSLWVVPLVVAGLIVIAAMFPHADMQLRRRGRSHAAQVHAQSLRCFTRR